MDAVGCFTGRCAVVCVTDSVLTVRLKSLGSDWGVGPCQLISADSIYDNFVTLAALMTCTALVHAAWACSCMVCFSAGYILPDLRKLTLYALNEALIRGPSSAEKIADLSLRLTATAVRTTLAPVLLLLYCCRCRPLRIRKPNRNLNHGF